MSPSPGTKSVHLCLRVSLKGTDVEKPYSVAEWLDHWGLKTSFISALPFQPSLKVTGSGWAYWAGELSHPQEETTVTVKNPAFKGGFLKPWLQLEVFIYISPRNIFQTHDSAVGTALGTLQAPGPFYNEPCR